MNNAAYLTLLRRRLVDVDDTAQRFTDIELWAATGDAALEFGVRGAQGYATYTVSEAGVSPEFTDEDALLTMYQTAFGLLDSLYTDKVNRGELGGSWRSGLEEESTLNVQRAYRESLDRLASRVEELLILRAKSVFAVRKQ